VIRVYAAHVWDAEQAIGQESLLGVLETRERERIARFPNPEDRMRSAVAHLLIRKVVAASPNVDRDRIQFARDVYGKPFVWNAPGFDFNLAHAGDWAVCATDSRPLGVDVEVVRPLDVEVAAGVLSAHERRDLLRRQPLERLRRFYELWTLKESYLKALGLGLRIPPDSFTVQIRPPAEIMLTGANASQGYHFQQYDVDRDHPAAVCATNDAFPQRIVYVESRELRELARRLAVAPR
jgi:4'-phosphopantetheinyl transferase